MNVPVNMYIRFLCEGMQATNINASSIKIQELGLQTIPDLRPSLYLTIRYWSFKNAFMLDLGHFQHLNMGVKRTGEKGHKFM